jgi:fluoride exporter
VSDVLLWIGVAALGGCGAVARVALTGAVNARAGGRMPLPLGTLAVNVSGSALLGFLSGLALSGDALLLAGTGLLGGYTTFSTWMVDSERLAQQGEGRVAVVNVVASIAAGVAAVMLGRALAG